MTDCTETTTQDLIQCVTNAPVSTCKPDFMWITALKTDVSVLADYSNQIKQYNFKFISANEFKDGEEDDASIHREVKYKHLRRFPLKAERVDEPQNVKALRHEWSNLWLEKTTERTTDEHSYNNAI